MIRRPLALTAMTLIAASAACSSGADVGDPEQVGATSQDLYGLGSLGLKWPNGSVPVCFSDPTTNQYLEGMIPLILATSWSRAAGIEFTGFGTCSSGNAVSVVFASGTRGLTDNLGYGERKVTLISDDTSPNLAHFTYEVIHEFGHALGFAHEMKRPDNWDGGVALQCAPPASDYSNYADTPGGLYLTATYDSASIMNYCDPDANQTTSLSPGDISGVSDSRAYGPAYLVPVPSAITLAQGPNQSVQIALDAGNSWAGTGQPITYTLGGLPAGVTATRADTYGTRWTLSASSTAALGTTVAAATGAGTGIGGQPETHTALIPIKVVSPPACQPATCANVQIDPGLSGAECGAPPDGCGGVLSCGTCPTSYTCDHYTCAAPPPAACNPADCGCAPGWSGGGCSSTGTGCSPCTRVGGGGGKGGCVGTCQ